MILWAYRLWENTQTKSLVLSTNILEGKKKKRRERETCTFKETWRGISTDCNIQTLFPN